MSGARVAALPAGDPVAVQRVLDSLHGMSAREGIAACATAVSYILAGSVVPAARQALVQQLTSRFHREVMLISEPQHGTA
jgi:hypothetical protein